MKARKLTAMTLALVMLISTTSGVSAMSAANAAKPNANIKNVIVFIGDGMSSDGMTLTRWYNSYDAATGKVDTTKKLAVDELASGLVRTYWMNKGVVGAITDSAPGGTAMAAGVKTVNKYVGVDDNKAPLANILEASRLAGKATGIVSTSQVMHATPADYTSHYPDRSKEQIIAEQQVYNGVDVVLGGGSKNLAGRSDNENLISVLKNNDYNYITTKNELSGLSTKTWGMFAPLDLAYEMDRLENKPTQPSLTDMTKTALNILSKDKEGFFLMVEGSKIDWAAHANDPIGLISDINAMDQAIAAALDFAKKDGHTMILITTDHGNGGVTIGNAATSGTYDNDPVTKFVAPLKKAKLTGEGLEAKLDETKSNIKEVMSKYYGIDDLTADEEAAIKAAGKGKLNGVVGPMLSKRAFIGWTTTGHTGEDVMLYSYLPGDDRITGTIENIDFAKINAAMWNLNLTSTTQKIYQSANAAFTAKGATVTVDNSNPNNPTMVVTKGATKLVIPENKNYVLVNGSIFETTTVTVNVADNFYVNSEVLGLIR